MKKSTKEKRGLGQILKISASTKIPRIWNEFLKNSENKDELFKFLAFKIHEYAFDSSKVVYVTYQDMVKITQSIQMPNCANEEADTLIAVHLLHALKHGAKKVQVRTVDSDIIVILIGKYQEIKNIFPNINLIVAFDKRKTLLIIVSTLFVKILGKMFVKD